MSQKKSNLLRFYREIMTMDKVVNCRTSNKGFGMQRFKWPPSISFNKPLRILTISKLN